MQEKEVYEYASIRFVPRVEREEFLNVGVIVFCKRKKYLRMKYHVDGKRLCAFSADVEASTLASYLAAWDTICQGSLKGEFIASLDPASRFRWLTATRSTIIQSSKVHPGLCDQPEQVLDELFTKYVL